ncbi:hypothetical protein A9Q99_09645 [Gammaproteobacteria bacterium 45_16_T64]|nr:hypothetical protein A9Q99_09645 [Gammaproteobacteria bacterium 45_16_T64]
MATIQRKIAVGDLVLGMYVSKLDCPWHMTPFPIQGFYVDSEQEVASLAGYCKFVFIDSLRTRAAKAEKSQQAASKKSASATKATSSNTQNKASRPLVRRPTKYKVSTPFKKELKKAQSIYRDLDKSVANMARQLQNRTEVDIASAIDSTKNIVSSVVRNPDAMIWVTKMKHSSPPLYQHAINCAIWAAILGREIGLSKPKLESLAAGVVLCKVGLFMLPNDHSQQADLADIKANPLYVKHVTLALKLLSQSKSLSKEIIGVVATHEERFNGSGFPQQLAGQEIPLPGQIAGLVDYYESLISAPLNAEPLTPADALGAMFHERDGLFQAGLIEAFIQALGLFPPGTIVKLNNQSIGVVTSNQKNKRLEPEIIIVLDEKKLPTKQVVVNLHTHNENEPDASLEIECSLPAGSYDIDISTIHRKSPAFIARLFG